MDSDVIRNLALNFGHNGTTYDGHDHDSGTVAGERSKFGHAQSEDAGEHDGVEKSDKDDAVHGEMSCGQHRNRDQRGSTYRANAQQASGIHFLQKSGTDEASDHRAAPVEGNETGCTLFRQSANFRLAEVVHQEAADGDLG